MPRKLLMSAVGLLLVLLALSSWAGTARADCLCVPDASCVVVTCSNLMVRDGVPCATVYFCWNRPRRHTHKKIPIAAVVGAVLAARLLHAVPLVSTRRIYWQVDHTNHLPNMQQLNGNMVRSVCDRGADRGIAGAHIQLLVLLGIDHHQRRPCAIPGVDQRDRLHMGALDPQW